MKRANSGVKSENKKRGRKGKGRNEDDERGTIAEGAERKGKLV